jgi:hypothetical protein
MLPFQVIGAVLLGLGTVLISAVKYHQYGLSRFDMVTRHPAPSPPIEAKVVIDAFKIIW